MPVLLPVVWAGRVIEQVVSAFERAAATAVSLAWGLPLVFVLVGGGFALTLYSRFVAVRRFRHALVVTSGRYDNDDDPGEISHFQALSTALAATIGVGNIGGVAIAVTQGGAGAVFWMWVAAAVGMTIKFFSCTLAQLYRAKGPRGEPLGGPMYTIELGLGRRFKPLAVLFATFGMVGCLPMFQANQVAEILGDQYGVAPWMTGLCAAVLVATVVFGGIKRIGAVTAKLVPLMCLTYLGLAIAVVVARFDQIPHVFAAIFNEAFSGRAAVGGTAGLAFREVVLIGVRRAAFSNEAGIGTAPIAHGAARTKEPVREGLVAMLGPFIDTIVICSITAFILLSAGDIDLGQVQGVSLTAQAISNELGSWAIPVLVLVILLFALSTMIGYSYYGKRCFGYLFGEKNSDRYIWIYLAGLFLGAVFSAATVVNVVDTAFALMAFPNMLATLVLAPRVMRATRDYLSRLDRGAF